MIERLRPYPAYKDSGLTWLGRVPSHWELKRIRSAVSNVVEQTTRMDRGDAYVALENIESWTGRVRPQKGEHLFTGQVKRFRPGDVLFCKLRPYLAKVTRLQTPGVCVGELFVLRPRDANMRSDFLERYLRSNPIIDVLNSSTFGAKMPRADWQFMGNLPLLFPPEEEQSSIVRFLEDASGRIERAIRAKKKLIALLNEQKQSIIHRAVTRGLDPSVPLKPSGIPWLGNIPRHWNVVRNLALFSHRVERGTQGLPVLQVSLRSGVTADDLDQFGRPKRLIADATNYKLVRQGDLAYNTMRMWQGAVGVVSADGLVSPAYVVIEPREAVHADFYELIFRTVAYKQQANRYSTGIVSDRNRLYWESFKQMPNLLVPWEEQLGICKVIREQSQDLNAAISRFEREIDLLREYRTRLIADIVTGEIDARDAAAHLRDEGQLETEALKEVATLEENEIAEEEEAE